MAVLRKIVRAIIQIIQHTLTQTCSVSLLIGAPTTAATRSVQRASCSATSPASWWRVACMQAPAHERWPLGGAGCHYTMPAARQRNASRDGCNHPANNLLHSAMVAAQESVQSSKEKYLEAFNKAVAGSMLNPPHFPADFIDKPAAEEGKTAELPKKLSLNFFLPHASFFQNSEVRPRAHHSIASQCLAQVDLVLIPAVTGDFGVMPGHVPTVAQLRPGVISVHKELDKDVEKYFVSSGFAFVHNDSTADVCAVEAVKLDDLDPEVLATSLVNCTLLV